MRRFDVLLIILAIIIFLLPVGKSKAAGSISVSTPPTTVEKNEKYEVNFTISGFGILGTDFNPYNPNITAKSYYSGDIRGIYIDGVFTKPSGAIVRWPVYWDGSKWILKFAPTETGGWHFHIFVAASSGNVNSTEYPFTVTNGQNKGFIEVNPQNTATFRFQNGDPFHSIGTATTSNSPYTMSEVFQNIGANGGNYARIMQSTGTALELENDASSLGNYRQDKAQNLDNYLGYAKANRVNVEFTIDHWDKIKSQTPQKSPYYLKGVATSNTEYFTKAEAKEIYKRKLRYILARWGYSTNLMAIEFINETYFDNSDRTLSWNWHTEMSKFIQGDKTVIPDWAGNNIKADHNADPHLATSSEGTDRLGQKNIPWSDAALNYINMHFYMRDYVSWGMVQGDSQEMQPMDSALDQPWKDTAVVADRVARMVSRQYKWNKPISITEYGLAIENIVDWEDAMRKDTNALHFHDAIWAGMFSGISFNQWSANYMLGGFGGGAKTWNLRPLSNYFSNDVRLDNFKQETAYPVVDSTNPSPKIVSQNSQIMANGWLSSNKAYFYTKNLTKVWAQILGPNGCIDANKQPVSCGPMPQAQSQTGNVLIKGLTPGSYALEKWSTIEQDKNAQIKSKNLIIVGQNGTATITVTLGIDPSNYDYAYKLYPDGKIELSTTASKMTANVGDTVTITNQISNSKTTTESSLKFTNYLPYRTSLETNDPGGVLGGMSTPCTAASNYNYPSCNGFFTVPTLTWSGVSLNPGETKNLNFTVKVLPEGGSGLVTYKDYAIFDNYVVGSPGTDVRTFLSLPSARTSDGNCVGKLVSANLNIYEQSVWETFPRKTIKILYGYYMDVTETNSVPKDFPLIDTGQTFTIGNSDRPGWKKIDVTEAMRNPLDPSMAFVLQEQGASQFGTTVLKGSNDSQSWGSAGSLYVGKLVNTSLFEGAAFTSLHSGDSPHFPYLELICRR